MASKSLADIVRARIEKLIEDNPERAMAFLLDTDNEAVQSKPEPWIPRNAGVGFGAGVGRQDGQQNGSKADGRRKAADADGRRQRRATVGYAVKRNRNGKPVAEPKRPADEKTYRFLVRHNRPVTVLELEKATGLSTSQVRNNLYRMQREGVIDTARIAE